MHKDIHEMQFLKAERFLPQTYNYFTGRAGGEFLKQLRDNKKFVGLKCPKCRQVYVPPRAICKHCFEELNNFVEVSDEGVLATYTTVYSPKNYHPAETPFTYGIIVLDGATTGLVHLIDHGGLHDLKTGIRVKAVFREERNASILDIRYFKTL